MERTIKLAAIAVVFAAIGTQAYAVDVSHSTAGTVFRDTFANDTLGAAPTLSGGDIGSSWTVNSAVESFVTDTATAGIAGSGKILAVTNQDGTANGDAVGAFGALYTTGTVTADFRAYVGLPTNNRNVLGAAFQNSQGGVVFNSGLESWTFLGSGQWAATDAGINIVAAGVAATDGVLAYFDGAWKLAESGGSVLKFNLEEWVDVQMKHNLDTDTMEFTVAGQTTDSIGFWTAVPATGHQNEIQAIVFRQNSDGQPSLSYVGFIPEPASLALLGLGGVLILRRRRAA
jgi:hypothetical protein